MNLGPSFEYLTPFSDEINNCLSEYQNKMTDCDNLATLLKNLQNDNDDTTPNNDLFIILNLKEKIETLALSIDIINNTKKDIDARFANIISIFKGVIDIDFNILQDIEKVNFLRDKISLLSKDNKYSDQFSACLKEVINQKVSHIPERVIFDLRFAVMRKEGRLISSLASNEKKIINKFVEINEKHRIRFASIQGIQYFEKMYVECQKKLHLIQRHTSQLQLKENELGYIHKFENAIKNNCLPKEILHINKIINRFSKDKPNLKTSQPITHAYNKSASFSLHSPAIISTNKNSKALLEDILEKGLKELRNMAGVKENEIDVYFETYKRSVLDSFDNEDFFTALPKIFDFTQFDLNKKVLQIDKKWEIEATPIMTILNNLNVKVLEFYEKQAKEKKKGGKKNPLLKRGSNIKV